MQIRLRRYLGKAGIDADVHYPVPDHRQPGFRPPVRPTSLIETSRAVVEIVTVPCFPEMTDEEIDRIPESIAALHEVSAV